MLAYILGITKLGIKRIRKSRQILGSTNRGKRVTNIGSLRDFKLGQKKIQIGEGISNWAKEISNRGRDYKSGQEKLQTGTGI